MVSSAKLSVEPVQGAQLFVTHEMRDEDYRLGVGTQLLPVYGLDVTATYKRTYGLVRVDEATAVVHLYF